MNSPEPLTIAMDPRHGEAAGRLPPLAAFSGDAAEGRERIGRYEVLAPIGGGGFGTVYWGLDPARGRPVAIKVCNRRDPETRRRFVREAEIGHRLKHRHIAAVIDSGVDRGTPYLVAEYLPGEDLSDLIERRQPDTLDEKIEILLQIASGLGHAHSLGVIHRDVKPSNVRVLRSGWPARRRVKLLDFGSAKSDRCESDLTAAGMIVGTVAYVAPECLSGNPPSAASDVFSFGVLAYELLAFRSPWNGRGFLGLVDGILHAPPRPLTEVECPAELAATVLRCLRKDPAQRWSSFAALTADLATYVEPLRRTAPN